MKSAAVFVRAGKVSDAALLREIRCESLLDSPHAFGTRYSDVVTQPLSYWKSLLRRRRYFLACDGASPVGMVSVDRYEHHGVIVPGVFSMYVQPSFRGHRVATDLIHACKVHVRERGQNVLYLDVVEGNLRAYAFYRREGFVDSGVTRAMPGDTHRQMITMMCEL